MPCQPDIKVATTSSIPTASKASPQHSGLIKSLLRLSRTSLIDLALKWLDQKCHPGCTPYLQSNRKLVEEDEEDYLWEPAASIEALKDTYEAMRHQKGTKRDLIDRILDGDWRRGLTLQQIAMIDFQHLEETDSSLRWTALRLVSREEAEGAQSEERPSKRRKLEDGHKHKYPRIHTSTFLRALHREISPMIKAHYHIGRLLSRDNLTVLRIYISDTPYNQASRTEHAQATESGRSLFLAFPDSCPYVYIALAGAAGTSKSAGKLTTDIAAMKRTILEAVAKALSEQHHRYSLETTNLTARSLNAMMALRGHERSGAANGVFSIFTDAVAEDTPLKTVKSNYAQKVLAPIAQENESNFEKKRNEQIQQSMRLDRSSALFERDPNKPTPDLPKALTVSASCAVRFGTTGLPTQRHKAPLDRFHVKIEERLYLAPEPVVSVLDDQSEESFDQLAPTPRKPRVPVVAKDVSLTYDDVAPIKLTFHGSDIFAGLRKVAEAGLVDMKKLPSWMTGEEGVSQGTVRHGSFRVQQSLAFVRADVCRVSTWSNQALEIRATPNSPGIIC